MQIVLADGVPLFREGLANLLRVRGHQVTVTTNCYELIAAGRRRKSGIILTDANLPQGANVLGARAAGIRATIELRRRDPSLNVVVLYSEPDIAAARALLATGTPHTAYLLKRRVAGVQNLTDALNRVAAGATIVDVGVSEKLVQTARVDPPYQWSSSVDPVSLLPRRRSEVLSLMADGYSNWRIAKEMSVTEAAVARHIAHIYSQLGLKRSVGTNRRVQAVLRLLHHREGAVVAATSPRVE